jgi:hypothetical protein
MHSRYLLSLPPDFVMPGQAPKLTTDSLIHFEIFSVQEEKI